MRNWQGGLLGYFSAVVKSTILYPVEYGCITQLYLNTAPEAERKGGAYYVPWAREAEPMAVANDEAVQDSCTYIYGTHTITVAKWVDEQVQKHNL